MNRFVISIVFAAVAGSLALPAAADDASDRALIVLRDSADRVQKGDLATAEAELKAVVATPAFASLTTDQQHAAYFLLTAVALQLNHADIALDAAKHATAMKEADGSDWYARGQADWMLSDWADCVLSFTTMAGKWPASLSDVNDTAVFRLVHEAGKLPSGDEKELGLLRALFAANWKPHQHFADPSPLWFEYARLALGHGQKDEASRAIAGITDGYTMIALRADRRFDTVVGDRARLDVAKAANAALDARRSESAGAVDRLEGVNAVALALIELRRDGEALTLLDDALKRAQRHDGKPAFSDADDMLEWTMAYRALALYHLGRFDDAVSQQRDAAARPEDGKPNVANAINLGDMLYSLGRAREALDAVATVSHGGTSPYGVMQYQEVAACSYAQLGDDAKLAEALAALHAHAKDAPRAVYTAELCANHLDQAASVLIDWLKDPEGRGEALTTIQKFGAIEHPGTFEAEIETRMAATIARTDVAAEIASIGRIEAYALRRPGE